MNVIPGAINNRLSKTASQRGVVAEIGSDQLVGGGEGREGQISERSETS